MSQVFSLKTKNWTGLSNWLTFDNPIRNFFKNRVRLDPKQLSMGQVFLSQKKEENFGKNSLGLAPRPD